MEDKEIRLFKHSWTNRHMNLETLSKCIGLEQDGNMEQSKRHLVVLFLS